MFVKSRAAGSDGLVWRVELPELDLYKLPANGSRRTELRLGGGQSGSPSLELQERFAEEQMSPARRKLLSQ